MLRECESVVVVIGPRWATVEGDHGRRIFEDRDWVRYEVERALQRQDVQVEKTGTDDVERILSNVTQRALTWAVVGAALAVWLTIVRGERRGGLGRGLLGLMLGALAGALGGAVFGAAVNLPEEALAPERREQIQIGALAVTGGGIGALLGKLWIPPRAGPGLIAGAAGGASAQIVLNAGDWAWSSSLAVGFRSLVMAGFVITTMFALDVLHTTAAARTGVRPAV